MDINHGARSRPRGDQLSLSSRTRSQRSKSLVGQPFSIFFFFIVFCFSYGSLDIFRIPSYAAQSTGAFLFPVIFLCFSICRKSGELEPGSHFAGSCRRSMESLLDHHSSVAGKITGPCLPRTLFYWEIRQLYPTVFRANVKTYPIVALLSNHRIDGARDCTGGPAPRFSAHLSPLTIHCTSQRLAIQVAFRDFLWPGLCLH